MGMIRIDARILPGAYEAAPMLEVIGAFAEKGGPQFAVLAGVALIVIAALYGLARLIDSVGRVVCSFMLTRSVTKGTGLDSRIPTPPHARASDIEARPAPARLHSPDEAPTRGLGARWD
jgi:hypothetical protein